MDRLALSGEDARDCWDSWESKSARTLQLSDAVDLEQSKFSGVDLMKLPYSASRVYTAIYCELEPTIPLLFHCSV